jgi:hypothetical protein
MVRKGLLPFGMNSISKKGINDHLWQKATIECDSLFEGKLVRKNPPFEKYCGLGMGFGNLSIQNGILWIPVPTISFALTKVCPDTFYILHGIYYSYLDEIPFLRRFRKDKFDLPRDYTQCNNAIIPFQLEKIFKKPKED